MQSYGTYPTVESRLWDGAVSDGEHDILLAEAYSVKPRERPILDSLINILKISSDENEIVLTSISRQTTRVIEPASSKRVDIELEAVLMINNVRSKTPFTHFSLPLSTT